MIRLVPALEGGIAIYKRIQRRAEQLAGKISEQEKLLKQFPEGNLFCSRNGKHFKWYRTGNRNKIYIPKHQRELAEQLAIKKYLALALQDMKKEQEALLAYLETYKNDGIDWIFEKPGYDELLRPFFQPQSSELYRWANEPYEKNEKHQENLIHKCISGIMVRSKSESMIASSLYMNRIPFRYEEVLHLKNYSLYPDFTIRHPRTGQIYYWEHFGLMDQMEYAKHAGSKIQQYIVNGIIPSIQLITTYETKEHPLSADFVEDIVEKYFL